MRTAGYMSLLNTFMILFLTLSKAKDTGWFNFNLGVWMFPIYIVMMVLIGFFGYLEMYVWKFFREEQKINYELSPSHPDVQEIKAKVDYLYNKEIQKCMS